MGRHARGAARSRISASTVLLGTLIVAVIAVGSWLSSRAQPTPITATDVSGSAVVVSSLACSDAGGETLVDVLTATGAPVRTSLDTCGHQEGELLAVRYQADDPAGAWIASQDPRGDVSTGDGLLPVGLGIAAMLGVLAGLAVWLDSRRSRRARNAGRPIAAHEVRDETALTADDRSVLTAGHPLPDADRLEAASPVPELLDADPAPVPTPQAGLVDTAPLAVVGRPTGRHAVPDPIELAPLPAVGSDDRRPSSVDLAFPFSSSLAASLHDELFTHRGATT